MTGQKGRPPNKGVPAQLKVTLPQFQHKYLTLLAKRSKIGVTENEIATHVLVREIDNMISRGYHDLELPDD